MTDRDLSEVSVGEILSEAFAAWRKNIVSLTSLFLIPFLLIQVPSFLVQWHAYVNQEVIVGNGLSELSVMWIFAGLIVFMLLGFVAYMGLYVCCLRAVRGRKFGLWTVFPGFRYLFKFFFAFVIICLPAVGAILVMKLVPQISFLIMILVLIYFIYIGITFMIMPFVLADNVRKGVIAVLRETLRLIHGFRLDLFGILLIFGLPTGLFQLALGFILDKQNVVQLLVVGLGFSFLMTVLISPWAMLSYARFYVEVKGRDLDEKPNWRKLVEERKRKAADGAAEDEDITPLPEGGAEDQLHDEPPGA